ncbi:hypothetical protein EAF00_012007 [Botryotinia globosa]|nr:hypothetical protein EAF00_012007 [Botryotinia globosa]
MTSKLALPLNIPPRSPTHICSYAIEGLTSSCKITWTDLETQIFTYWVRDFDSSTSRSPDGDKELKFLLSRRLGLDIYAGKTTESGESVDDILSKKIKSKIDYVRRMDKLNSSKLGLRKSERLNGKENVELEAEALGHIDADQIASSDPPHLHRADTPRPGIYRPNTSPSFEPSGSGSDSQNLPAQIDTDESKFSSSSPRSNNSQPDPPSQSNPRSQSDPPSQPEKSQSRSNRVKNPRNPKGWVTRLFAPSESMTTGTQDGSKISEDETEDKDEDGDNNTETGTVRTELSQGNLERHVLEEREKKSERRRVREEEEKRKRAQIAWESGERDRVKERERELKRVAWEKTAKEKVAREVRKSEKKSKGKGKEIERETRDVQSESAAPRPQTSYRSIPPRRPASPGPSQPRPSRQNIPYNASRPGPTFPNPHSHSKQTPSPSSKLTEIQVKVLISNMLEEMMAVNGMGITDLVAKQKKVLRRWRGE